jgi:ketosteroid isomerase-like protein
VEPDMSATYDLNAGLALSFIDAFNRRDIDDFVALLAQDVELRTPRGIQRGRRAAAAWAQKPLDHLDVTFEPERLLVTEDGVIVVGELVFHWKENGGLAERSEAAAVWRVEGGLIRSWEPFDSSAAALRAAGILPEPDRSLSVT